MSEGVEVDGGGGSFAELFLEIFTSLRDLTGKSFTRGQIAIGLNVPAAHDVPLAELYKLLNFMKQGRLVFLYPAINEGLVVAEDIAVKFAAEGCRTAEGGNGCGSAFFPLPLPNGVDVGGGYQVKLFHGKILSRFGL